MPMAWKCETNTLNTVIRTHINYSGCKAFWNSHWIEEYTIILILHGDVRRCLGVMSITHLQFVTLLPSLSVTHDVQSTERFQVVYYLIQLSESAGPSRERGIHVSTSCHLTLVISDLADHIQCSEHWHTPSKPVANTIQRHIGTTWGISKNWESISYVCIIRYSFTDCCLGQQLIDPFFLP